MKIYEKEPIEFKKIWIEIETREEAELLRTLSGRINTNAMKGIGLTEVEADKLFNGFFEILWNELNRALKIEK